jgi:hypothetical protein
MDAQPDLVKQLEGRARDLEADQVDKQERLRQLQNDIRSSQAAIDALRQVIAFERASRGEVAEVPAMSRVVPLQRRREEPVTQSRAIADAALKILEAAGPLYYRELTSRLLHAGVSIGGSDPNASVIGALVRDGRFYRPKRGTYYVRELARGQVTNVGQRRRKGA